MESSTAPTVVELAIGVAAAMLAMAGTLLVIATVGVLKAVVRS